MTAFVPGIGPLELAIVGVVLLLLFGPRRLPELGRSLGGGMRECKDSIAGARVEEADVRPLPTAQSQPRTAPAAVRDPDAA